MVHQLEGILLVRIVRDNICNSYEAKSKTFLIGDDFSRVKAPVKVGDSLN